MDTVNFPCGHCGKLMAVTPDSLGKQVRCPHCQEVVTAPATVGEPLAVCPPPAPDGTERESIFAAPEPSDDLFGLTAPRQPLEIPPLEPPPHQGGEGPAAAPPPPAAATEVVPWPPTAPDAAPEPSPFAATATFPPDGPTFPTLAPTAPAQELPVATDWPGAPQAEPPGDLPAPLPARAPRRRGSGLGPILVLIFLIPYAIFATGAAVYFYFQLLKTPHPLEVLPDIEGDKPGAARKEAGTQFQRVVPDAPLPARMHVKLGQPIRIGDVEVLPQKIEARKIVFGYEDTHLNPNPSQQEALVLTLTLRNVSRDIYFAPADAAFYRRWKEGAKTKPYTFLEVGPARFYGGAVDRPTRGRRDEFGPGPGPGEYVEGQENYDRVLDPGKEMTTSVCTDPENTRVLDAVHKYKGTMLWRVEVRRGLVQVGKREVPACAVVGVEFNRDDVQ
jgi:hypothetical protein